MNIQLDDGLQFGLGVFETICLLGGIPVFADWHLERMNRSLEVLGIPAAVSRDRLEEWLAEQIGREDADSSCYENNRGAMKILATEKNILMMKRSNPYTEEKIRNGFSLDYSRIIRNETSPLVYHKTLNYGDNIMEKRRTSGLSADELLFLNTKGEVTEGTTTNIFLVKEGVLATPAVSCGLLPGILRRFVLENSSCEEKILYPEDLESADEIFVTNSLMGIMPVKELAGRKLKTGAVTERLLQLYHRTAGGS